MLEREREVQKFDQVAASYGQLHQRSLTASGENPEYFAEYKIACLRRLGARPSDEVLDYGCGVGSLTSLLVREFSSVAGFDPSRESLEAARIGCPSGRFHERSEDLPSGHFQWTVLSGVLHHVPPDSRAEVLGEVRRTLRTDGKVVIFEHNPWNPLTRRAVDACPFDDDAILLPPGELRTRLAQAGYERVRQDFIVFFPRILAWFRPLEPWLRWCPLGAQTMTVASK